MDGLYLISLEFTIHHILWRLIISILYSATIFEKLFLSTLGPLHATHRVHRWSGVQRRSDPTGKLKTDEGRRKVKQYWNKKISQKNCIVFSRIKFRKGESAYFICESEDATIENGGDNFTGTNFFSIEVSHKL